MYYNCYFACIPTMHLLPELALHKLRSIVVCVVKVLVCIAYVGAVVFLLIIVIAIALLVLCSTRVVSRVCSACIYYMTSRSTT